MCRSVNQQIPLEHRGGLYTVLQGLWEAVSLLPPVANSHGFPHLLSPVQRLSGLVEVATFTQENLKLNSIATNHQKEVSELLTVRPTSVTSPQQKFF